MAIGIYLYDKFVEEDGDGINLVIMSDQRIELERKMEELMENVVPARFDEQNQKYYYVTDLDEIFMRVKRIVGYETKR